MAVNAQVDGVSDPLSALHLSADDAAAFWGKPSDASGMHGSEAGTVVRDSGLSAAPAPVAWAMAAGVNVDLHLTGGASVPSDGSTPRPVGDSPALEAEVPWAVSGPRKLDLEEARARRRQVEEAVEREVRAMDEAARRAATQSDVEEPHRFRGRGDTGDSELSLLADVADEAVALPDLPGVDGGHLGVASGTSTVNDILHSLGSVPAGTGAAGGRVRGWSGGSVQSTSSQSPFPGSLLNSFGFSPALSSPGDSARGSRMFSTRTAASSGVVNAQTMQGSPGARGVGAVPGGSPPTGWAASPWRGSAGWYASAVVPSDGAAAYTATAAASTGFSSPGSAPVGSGGHGAGRTAPRTHHTAATAPSAERDLSAELAGAYEVSEVLADDSIPELAAPPPASAAADADMEALPPEPAGAGVGAVRRAASKGLQRRGATRTAAKPPTTPRDRSRGVPKRAGRTAGIKRGRGGGRAGLSPTRAPPSLRTSSGRPLVAGVSSIRGASSAEEIGEIEAPATSRPSATASTGAPQCRAPGCPVRPRFGPTRAAAPSWCAEHARSREERLVDVYQRHCMAQDCGAEATWGRVGHDGKVSREFCARHGKQHNETAPPEEQVRRTSGTCESCAKVAKFGVAGTRTRRRCADHKNESDVRIDRQRRRR